jgi:hypothetical protein
MRFDRSERNMKTALFDGLQGRKFNKIMAGAGGFEPPYGGIKIRCLTAWRRPNRLL